MTYLTSAYEQAPIGDLELMSGEVLHDTCIGYKTWGELNSDGDNAIILPSYYSGTVLSYTPWIKEGPCQILDPSRYFVVAYDQLGAGKSSRPSSCGGYDNWPAITCTDSVNAARKLVDSLGVKSAQLVLGWSMGGMQTFAWAARYPGFARAALAVCATPGCEAIGQVFLHSIRPILRMAVYGETRETRLAALGAFGAAYSGWAYSDEFFESGKYTQVGYGSIQELVDGWSKDHMEMEADDLLAQLECWLSSTEPDMSIEGEQQTKLVSMPGSTDRYFLAQSRSCLKVFPGSTLKPLESTLGHIAGRPGIRAQETEAIRTVVAQLLDEQGLAAS